jgi:hypothetical protein
MNPARRPLFLAGVALVAFSLAANVPYAMLIERFGYDDVLREPPLRVLAAFAAGGLELILIWLAFAVCALAFVAVAGQVDDALKAGGAAAPRFVALAGGASALAQAIGLSRWAFVVPGLADTALDPAATEAQRAAAVAIYTALHQFAGVAIGEHIGQTLAALWTAGVSWALLRGAPGPRVLGVAGLMIAPLWIVGQSELLATVISGFPVVEAAPIAFMAWEAWLLVLGVTWIVKAVRRQAQRSAG